MTLQLTPLPTATAATRSSAPTASQLPTQLALADDLYSTPPNLTSFLDRRPDGRPLAWRTGLPPSVGGLGLLHLEQQKEHLYPHNVARGRSRATRDSPERLRYDMNDFVKSTVWANHDMLRLRPSTLGCGQACQKAICVDCEPTAMPAWLARTNGEHLHVHDNAAATTHMILSLVDAAAAIEYGWAQATATAPMPEADVHYVTVYPPRCAAEMADWKRLVLASVRFCTYTSQEMNIRRPERL